MRCTGGSVRSIEVVVVITGIEGIEVITVIRLLGSVRLLGKLEKRGTRNRSVLLGLYR